MVLEAPYLNYECIALLVGIPFCYMGIMVDLSANESFNSQCIVQISFGISYCCRWVFRGQFRQMPLAVRKDVTLSLSHCHLTSAVMTELLESSLWFKSAV